MSEAHPAGRHWNLRPGVTYLNHGSFGPAPAPVLQARAEWMERLQAEPMDFFVRQLEEHLQAALDSVGRFVGTSGRNLAFVDNATFGMNVVARSFPLKPGDEVLCTDHEYGAVLRTWRRLLPTGATVRVQCLPRPLADKDEAVEALFSGVTKATRLLVVSHVTSATAAVLPIREICRRAEGLGIPVCVDGPHAPAAVEINLDAMGCDFYAASGHKWLSAPFGSGFLYVHPRRQRQIEPAVVSWGASLAGKPARWSDELLWSGTRDPSAFLAMPAAIEFLRSVGLDEFRWHSLNLVQYARERIVVRTGLPPAVADDSWLSTMISLCLPEHVGETPPSHIHPLQQALWERHQIEIPIVNWGGHRWVRVSAHLYNTRGHIDALAEALGEQGAY